MKKLTFLVVILSMWGVVASAQYDPKARTILDAMSTKYSKIGPYKANIQSIMTNESDGLNEVASFDITVKGNMFRLKLEEQEIYNDGKTVWTHFYIPDDEVNEVEINNYDPDEKDINPAKIYNAYKEGYKYLLVEETTEAGVKCDVVDLVAENAKDSEFFKIRLNISQKDRSLISWTMFEKTGTRYTYKISKFQSGLNVTDTFFKFDPAKFPGVDIVDLR